MPTLSSSDDDNKYTSTNNNDNNKAFQLMMSYVQAEQVLSLQSSLSCASL